MSSFLVLWCCLGHLYGPSSAARDTQRYDVGEVVERSDSLGQLDETATSNLLVAPCIGNLGTEHVHRVFPRFVPLTVSYITPAHSSSIQNVLLKQPQFQYRLSKCGEICMGIYTSHEGDDIATAQHSAPVYSGAPERKSVLLGHIVATKTTNPTVTDDDMDIPKPDSPDPKLGHKEEGRTVCVHSLAVLPGYQGRGLGKTLMKAFLQRIESHGVADRVALIARESIIPYYEKLGFVNKGKSEVQFAGGGWYDLVQEFQGEHELTMEEMA